MSLSAPFDDVKAGDSVRERLLLHWVNSLPLTKCLLIEGLRDLRFGDVLDEIVRWLQKNPGTAAHGEIPDCNVFDTDEIVERLRRVVRFAASECRSQDEDAMYVVNDPRCLDRVISGESDAIGAVLTVLKRLSVQRMRQHQSSERDKDALCRRRAQEIMLEHSLQETHSPDELLKEDVEPMQTPKRVQTSSGRSRAGVNTTETCKDVYKEGKRQQEPNTTKQGRKKPTTGAKRRPTNRSAPGTTASTPNIVDNKEIPRKKNSANNDKGLRVFGVLDPTAKYQPHRNNSSSSKWAGDQFDNTARSVRFCDWARVALHLEMPLEQIFNQKSEDWKLHSPNKIRQVFADGVLLRRIAAATVQRYGGQLNHNALKTTDLTCEDFVAVNAPAEKRRNFTLALAIFKTLGVSSEALNSLESLQHQEKQVPARTIWRVLDEVLNRAEQLARAAATTSDPLAVVDAVPEALLACGNYEKSKASHAEEQNPVSSKHHHSPRHRRRKTIITETEHAECVPLKRNLPYITSEQMHVVNKWLVQVGFDATKKVSGCGVLQDPMRNGALLCKVLIQELKNPPFSYFNTPRTLTEMRENISKAFQRLGKYAPSCYLTSCAEQAVLIGDRQIAYGILWHLSQASYAALTSGKAKEGGGNSSIDIHETRKVERVEPVGKLSASLKPSPLLLDIPAVALASQGNRAVRDDKVASYQVQLHDTFVRRLAWSEDDPSGTYDDDDVFPVPRAPFSSPVYSHDLDLVPKEREIDIKHHNVDDLLPTRSTEPPSRDLASDRIPPSIVIGELSAEVVTRIPACDDQVELAEPDMDDELQVSSAVNPAVQTQPNARLSQEPVEEILEWLKRLGIRLKNVPAFHDANSKLTEFQSGVLLCCIVEKMEFMRSIPGITRPAGKQPLSKASALHNIAKALNILQQKKTVPLHLLRRVNAIYAGNRDVILQLLLQIRKAYGHHHHASRRRPTQRFSSAAAPS